MTRLLLVCLGGALGSGARYLTGLAVPRGTLFVNLLGSLVIAVVLERVPAGDLRLFLATGILGGFTTYSAFNQETLELIRTGAWPAAFANVALTLFGCLAAGFLGVMVARAWR